MMYGSTAMGIDREHFDGAFEKVKNEDARARLGRPDGQKVLDTELTAEELERIVARFKEIYREHTGSDFPQDPFTQLAGAINAVFRSWMSEKAVTYRRVENITGLNGTAVNVCRMVFGNMGDDCGTGVCFTRDPSTGENVYYGDLLINAQGEDVVAGVRTPIKLDELRRLMPEAYDQLEAVRIMLEVHYRDMQDLEFTIERNKLYMLQCRTGKRSPTAAFKIAVDQATEGVVPKSVASALVKKKYLPKRYGDAAHKPVLTREDAIRRITAEDIERLFYPIISSDIPRAELDRRRMGEGINAVPGAAGGEVVFTAAEAEERAAAGAKVILVRKETSPEDVGGMHAASGILTATGGKTSHAAVVARGWGKCCIVGCDELRLDGAARTMSLGGRTLSAGDWITLDGSTGAVYEGKLDLVRPQAPPEYDTLMAWCDERRTLKVRTNADTPEDAARAVAFGAEGIGLCRTEHMFFDPSEPQRIRAMREMILSETEDDRRRALDKLLPFQRKDFEGIFRAMNGLPVTIRLIDPPLHEFLPQHDNPKAQQDAADDLNAAMGDGAARVTVEDIQRRVDQLHESNPMLGHRGCRLCITYPEILEMQVRAIMEAAVTCHKAGVKVLPEIMIPLSIDAKELRILVERTRAVADRVLEEARLGGGGKRTAEGAEGAESGRGAGKTAYAAAVSAMSVGGNGKAAGKGKGGKASSNGNARKGGGGKGGRGGGAGAKRGGAGGKGGSGGAGGGLTYMVGTMIETPRAALTADDMAEVAEFFSFGTNDLTQTTMALSRDDAGRFLPEYVDEEKAGIFPADPFQSIDIDGVGKLVAMAVELGRRTRPKIKLGVCGEHGGDPASIRFFQQVGLDYVSCSPFRVPIARLVAAQAAVEGAGGKKGKGEKLAKSTKIAPRATKRSEGATPRRTKHTKSTTRGRSGKRTVRR
ncbi:MAG: pyruvate, phosphate dikinase [Phycisphaerales bacterium]|nr:MAG: pyruvate, phosphate dikinase [Phycisphaerales bacterium]